MKFLASILFAVPMLAQLQVVYLPEGALPVPVTASVNLGNAATGDASDFRFRAANTGAAPIPLQNLSINGAAFSLAAPFQPVTIQPGNSFDFSVRFRPTAAGSYSASLSVNTFTAIVRATAVPAPLFGYEGADVSGTVRFDTPITISRRLDLYLRNPGTAPIPVQALQLSGDGFALDPPDLPLTLAPGQQVPFTVFFRSDIEGEYAARLTAAGRQLQIIATTTRPRLGTPRILTQTAPVLNGRPVRLQIQFAEAAIIPGSGTLRATFTGAFEDPAIVFPNGERQIAFQVAAGSREATFNGSPEVTLQTGTTTGTLRVEAVTESGTASQSYFFAPSSIVIDAAEARRAGSNLEIAITGFDNTRTAGSLNFRFFDRTGNPIGGVIAASLSEEFRSHFTQGQTGGIFRLRATFPVTGDATMVGSVLIEIANSIGRTDLQRLTFP